MTKLVRTYKVEKTAFSINGVGNTGQRIKPDFSPHMQKKSAQDGLKASPETVKLLEENRPYGVCLGIHLLGQGKQKQK